MHWPLAAASSTGRAGNTWAAAVDPPRPVALRLGLRGGTVAQADRNPFYLPVEVAQQNVNGDRHGAGNRVTSHASLGLGGTVTNLNSHGDRT